MLKINIQLFAHKKGMGSTKNGRDSESKRLGVSAPTVSSFWPGNILVKQRGTHIHPGVNVGRGSDDPCSPSWTARSSSSVWAATARWSAFTAQSNSGCEKRDPGTWVCPGLFHDESRGVLPERMKIMFIDSAKIKIKAGDGETGPSPSAVKNMWGCRRTGRRRRRPRRRHHLPGGR